MKISGHTVPYRRHTRYLVSLSRSRTWIGEVRRTSVGPKNLAKFVGNGTVVSCLTVGICTARMVQPIDVVDIEIVMDIFNKL